MSGPDITQATFKGMPTKDKLNVLFDFAVRSHDCACKTEERMESLEKKVDRRWKLNASIAAVSGFFGGVVAHIGQTLFSGGAKPPAGI